jgi:tetratricopeptide (TPR) repeat protein
VTEAKRNYNRAYYLKNKSKWLDRNRAVRSTPEGRARHNAWNRAYKKRNPDKLLEQWRRYEKSEHRKAYLEKMKEHRKAANRKLHATGRYKQANAKYREGHRKEARESTAKWRKMHPTGWHDWCRKNPDKYRVIRTKKFHKRRALKLLGRLLEDPKITGAKIKYLKTAPSLPCRWCKKDTTADTRHIDHIIPLNRKGPHIARNLCAACPTCNIAKKDKMPREFLAMVRAKSTHHRKKSVATKRAKPSTLSR